MYVHTTSNKKGEIKAAQEIAERVMKEWDAQAKGWTGDEVAEEVVRRESFYRAYYGQIRAYVEKHPLTRG